MGLRRESGSNFKADGSGGSGAYQFIQSTWDAYVVKVDAGYVGVRPHLAPPYLQEEMFWVVRMGPGDVRSLAWRDGIIGARLVLRRWLHTRQGLLMTTEIVT